MHDRRWVSVDGILDLINLLGKAGW